MAASPLIHGVDDAGLPFHSQDDRRTSWCGKAIAVVGSMLLLSVGVTTGVSSSEDPAPTEVTDSVRRTLEARPISYNAPEGHQPFSFDAPFGDNMVLQGGEATRSAVYGFLGPYCEGVQLDLYEATQEEDFAHLVFSTQDANINATHQPFNAPGESIWGARPCSNEDCPNDLFRSADRSPFNPWNEPLPKWKVLLPPQHYGGNYTIQATCLGSNNGRKESLDETITMNNVTFGDVWYCSGQSNMELGMKYTFHRRTTANDILHNGKYHNIRLMAGKSCHSPYHHAHDTKWNYAKYGSADGTNPWMTAQQSVHRELYQSPLFDFGATCWYFAQNLVDMGVTEPIGLINTAIGGRRIQEFMDNSTIARCHNRTRAGHGNQEESVFWEGSLYASQVLPFVDMTVKGFLWYQGENNMFEVKGNAAHDVGYGCEMQGLIESWRKVWSETPDTTSPVAPFGLVTLVSSGDEGGPDMGAMRQAQTANYGVLPPPHHPLIGENFKSMEVEHLALANTFVAQTYDLEDEWDGNSGPCFRQKCCTVSEVPYSPATYDPNSCPDSLYKLCNSEKPIGACTAAVSTNYYMGKIHPRSKREVGQRLATAAYNLFFGGEEPYTGPTLQGCSVQEKVDGDQVLDIRFNTTLLRGDHLAEPVFPPWEDKAYSRHSGGTQLFVQIDSSKFCMESSVVYDGELKQEGTRYICPTWAGGTWKQSQNPVDEPYEDGWIEVPFSIKNNNTIAADLSKLPEGATPTAVRYAWGMVDCCDRSDPEMFVTKTCIANCPIKTAKGDLPANPFMAKIVDGQCECVAPQVCSDGDNNLAGVN